MCLFRPIHRLFDNQLYNSCSYQRARTQCQRTLSKNVQWSFNKVVQKNVSKNILESVDTNTHTKQKIQKGIEKGQLR